jgi:hypothetical protein
MIKSHGLGTPIARLRRLLAAEIPTARCQENEKP